MNQLPAFDPNAALAAVTTVLNNGMAGDPNVQALQAAAQAPLAVLASGISGMQQQIASLQQQLTAAQAASTASQAQVQQAQTTPTVTPQQAALVALGTGAVGALAGWGLSAWLESRKHKKLAMAHEARENPTAAAYEPEDPPRARRRRRMR
jgi:hypothetical protein